MNESDQERDATMSISDKTRKLLWGKSGNRCAICKRELNIDADGSDDTSVVGDECHIVSRKVHGPRYDGKVSEEMLDSYDNLILLCRVHHKMIDDLVDDYTVDSLRQTKKQHELWVRERLDAKESKTDDWGFSPLTSVLGREMLEVLGDRVYL